MEISVFAETLETDQKAYETIVSRIFLEKLHNSEVTVRRLENLRLHGKADLINQLPTALRLIYRRYSNLDYVIILADADGEYPTITNKEKRKVKERIATFATTFTGQIIVGMPTRNIEAWMLGDVENIRNITGLTSIQTYPYVENIDRPKETLREIFGQYKSQCKRDGRPHVTYPEFIVKLCESLNLVELTRRSRTFASFWREFRS